VGSFLNVVIHRVPRAESVIRPASRCPHCEAPIRAWHNVPVLSWLVLRGRCASCHGPISVRYPLVELGTAALFVAVTARFGVSPELPAYLYFAAITVALALIDVDVRRLPNAIVLPSYAVAAVLLVATGHWSSAGRALVGMLALFGFYFFLWYVHRRGMGFGDVKLAGLLGLYLGWLSWASVFVGAFAGFFIGGLIGGALMLARRAGRTSLIPFGPAMLAGALLALFAAGPIAGWYTSLLTA
jgi:leader peptidase (prepilin peptidase) / N-methyltransferase